MTPAQKQALFTLRQALVICEAAGIFILSSETGGAPWILWDQKGDCERLTVEDIDWFEKELGE